MPIGKSGRFMIRQLGISEQTFYRWKKQYAGMQSEQVREFNKLQDENGRFKQLVAELSLDKAILQDIATKKVAALELTRQAVDYIVDHWHLPKRRARGLVK